MEIWLDLAFHVAFALIVVSLVFLRRHDLTAIERRFISLEIRQGKYENELLAHIKWSETQSMLIQRKLDDLLERQREC